MSLSDRKHGSAKYPVVLLLIWLVGSFGYWVALFNDSMRFPQLFSETSTVFIDGVELCGILVHLS